MIKKILLISLLVVFPSLYAADVKPVGTKVVDAKIEKKVSAKEAVSEKNLGKPVATLTIFLGEVEYLRNGDSVWKAVKRGMFFYEGDTVKTRADGKAELYFSDASVLRIANESEMQFNKVDGKKKRSVFMKSGSIWNKVTKGTNFEIESVYGVASVKGTEFDIQIKNSMEVWVAEGLVEVSNAQGSVLAGKNTHASVRQGEAVSKNKIETSELPPREVVQALAELKVTAVGNKVEGSPFELKLVLTDAKTGKLLSGESVLKVKSNAKFLKFSNNKTGWSDDLEVKVLNGKANIFALPSDAGEIEIFFTGETLTGVSLQGTVMPEIRQRTVILNFNDFDGKEKTLNLEFKKE